MISGDVQIAVLSQGPMLVDDGRVEGGCDWSDGDVIVQPYLVGGGVDGGSGDSALHIRA